MRFSRCAVALLAGVVLCGCAKKQESEAPKADAGAVTSPAEQPAGGPHAFVHLKDGTKTSGTVVASSPTDMVVAGDDGIERKIPLSQIKSVEYAEAAKPAVRAESSQKPVQLSGGAAQTAARQPAAQQSAPPAPPSAPPPATLTYELPAGSEISIRTNEAIDSGKAAEGQTFDAQVTRDARDANGAVVIPRGSSARIVIKSASKGGHFRGASDLVLDLRSVTIHGRSYSIDTADISQKGKSGVGANRRTAEFTGGGAALGAIVGAIAGGGKGAAIGSGAGAGAGLLTQVLTKGGAIKVPAESVLTFSLDRSLRVTADQ